MNPWIFTLALALAFPLSTATGGANTAEVAELPVVFEPNRGQAAPEVRFLARTPGQQIAIGSAGATIWHRNRAVSIRFPGSLPETVKLEASGSRAGVSHYFQGRNEERWITHVPTFSQVRARAVLPGIDVVYYGNRGRLEYDFLVAPGADPSIIRVRIAGVEDLQIGSAGELLAGGFTIQERPVAWQMIDDRRSPVAVSYSVTNSGDVAFRLGEYNPDRELVIDPVVRFSTFLGGSGLEEGWAVATDADGFIYMAGSTESPDFPVTPGAIQDVYDSTDFPGDAFVTKLSPGGNSVVYSTFLGGAATDIARAIAVNGAGEVFVAGETESFNYPATLGAFQIFHASIGVFADGFVTKLSADGASLVYSTYLGDDFVDRVYGISLDPAGNAVVAGASDSSGFPTTAGAFQRSCTGFNFGGFVTNLSDDGRSLNWSTRLCGSSADEALAVAVDSRNDVLVGGVTLSEDFPVTPGSFRSSGADGQEDGFVVKLSSDGGGLLFGGYLGGSAPDAVHGVAGDGAGIAYVAGRTLSADFPVTVAAFQPAHADGGGFDDAFVSAISVDGTTLVYSTFLGGGGTDQARAISADAGGGVYLTGFTEAADFPVSPTTCQTGYSGKRDAFALKLGPGGGPLEFGMLLGGREDDAGYAIATGPDGSAVVAGRTASSNFTTTAGALRPAYASGYRGSTDTFVARIDPGTAPEPPCVSLNGLVNGASFLPGPVAPGEIVTFFGAGLGPAAPVSFDLNGGDRIATELAGVQVFFDEIPAPVIAVSAGQVNAIVPYAVDGLSSVTVRIENQGVPTSAFALPVAASTPAIFTQNASGRGPGAILNQDFGLNRPDNPAEKGSIVQIFATGEGQTNPPGIDGKLAVGDLPAPRLPVSVTIGGLAAPVKYAGAAPGLVSGLIQINAEIPRGVASGSAIPVIVQIGDKTSPNGVTLSIR